MSHKIYTSSAERQKAYRARRKAETGTSDGRQRLDRMTDYRRANPDYRYIKKKADKYFIAIDSEGITRDGEHICCLLGDSEGRYIENYQNGIASHDAFEFLIECGEEKHSVVVGYSIGYDINMILKDCNEVTLTRLAEGLRATQKFKNGSTYSIEWMPGKSFHVSRVVFTPEGKREIEASVLVYDVFGFFQKAFVKTANEFKVVTEQENQFLTEMKLDRSNFKKQDRVKIREYNLLECRVLVRIMDQLRDAMKIAGCLPDRWHGAGAIASTLLKNNGMKEKNHTPPEMEEHFLAAYYGGRIQVLEMGEHHNIYTHDVISAYPSAMMELPSSIGEWKATSKFRPKDQFALYVVEWNLPEKTLISPFPFREEVNGTRTISYPTRGKGCYWYPEVKAALDAYGDRIKIHYGYYFVPVERYAFTWIKELFEARKRFKLSSNPKEQLANVPVKLGLNSLYGKCAQGIGFRGARPPYQNYFWAGWITSKTRARMFSLAMQSPKDIIAFATDGVFSKRKLAENGTELGEWEVDSSDYLFILKAGLYAFGKDFDQGKKSRGHFIKDISFEQLRDIWRKDGCFGTFSYRTTKFFGLKVSLAQNIKKWRHWIEVDRTVNFFPSNQIPIDHEKVEITKRLKPYLVEKGAVSLPYVPKGDWYEGDEGQQFLEELDQLDSFFDE